MVRAPALCAFGERTSTNGTMAGPGDKKKNKKLLLWTLMPRKSGC